MLQPVIIAGGSGTRLWSLSRQLYPKQFLPLVGKQTMLQATLARLTDSTAQHRLLSATKIIALSPRNNCA